MGLGIAAVLLLGVAGRLGLAELRRFVELVDTIYVLPRTVNQTQSGILHKYPVPYNQHYIVSVKVNPLDEEAKDYASKIYEALKHAGWDALLQTFAPAIGPSTDIYGLCIYGFNSPTTTGDPALLLANAFAAANIPVSCRVETASSHAQLFVVVGHRPVALNAR